MVRPWRLRASLGLAGPTAAPAFASPTELLAQAAQGVEHVFVEVLENVKDAQLVSGLGPQFGQHRRIQVRAIGDHDAGSKPPLLEVVQEAAHVVLIVAPHQREGHREVVDRVGGQQQGTVSQVNFVDAEGAGEIRQRPLSVGRQVGLADLPIEAVVEKALGEIEMEIALEGQPEPFHAHAVVEQAVEDRLADPVGILGPRFDPLDRGAEGLAAGTTGAVFSDLDFQPDDFAICEIAHAAGVHILASSAFATAGAGEGLRGAREAFHAHARMNGIHACVPPGFGA